MNQKIKAIIVEDEPIARMGLVEYVNETDFIDLCQICENAKEANNAISHFQPELMFLDIQMPRTTGIEFLKSLKNQPMVILTTAYPNYALQGFELDVIDYLVKPYPFDRYLKAVNKARDLFLLKTAPKDGDDRTRNYFFVKANQKYERVNFDAILYIEGLENYIVIHTVEGKLVTMMTMKSVETELSGQNFIRIHKSYIINIDRVKSLEGNQLKVGNVKLPISRQNKQEVINRILK